MFVYLANKTRFREDILSNRIEEIVHESFQRTLGKSVGAIPVQFKSQPQRGYVLPVSPCHNASPPFTSTSSFPQKTATPSSAIPFSARSGIEWNASHTATRFHSTAQGCASRYPGNGSTPIINPNGVASSSGIDTPPRTHPRWGNISHSTGLQGSRGAATLGFVMESLWDMGKGVSNV